MLIFYWCLRTDTNLQLIARFTLSEFLWIRSPARLGSVIFSASPKDLVNFRLQSYLDVWLEKNPLPSSLKILGMDIIMIESPISAGCQLMATLRSCKLVIIPNHHWNCLQGLPQYGLCTKHKEKTSFQSGETKSYIICIMPSQESQAITFPLFNQLKSG